VEAFNPGTIQRLTIQDIPISNSSSSLTRSMTESVTPSSSDSSSNSVNLENMREINISGQTIYVSEDSTVTYQGQEY